MGKGGAPKPPDPKETAAAQTSTNIGTAIASNHMQMMDQYTPWGSMKFSIAGGGGGSASPAAGAAQPRSARPERPRILDMDFENYRAEMPMVKGGFDRSEGYWNRHREDFEGQQQIARQKYLQDVKDWEASGGGAAAPAGGGGGSGSGWMTWNDPTTGKSYRIPRYESRMTLNPELQRALDAQFTAGRRLSEQIADNAQSRLTAPELATSFADVGGVRRTFDDAGPVVRTYGDPEGYAEQRQRVEDALMERMQPYIDRDRDALETRMVNQGLMPGSEARGFRVAEFDRGVSDARLGAILNAGQEQNRLADLDRSRAVFENAAQGQEFGQNQALAAFANTAQQQAYQQALGRATFGNQSKIAQFNAEQAALNDPINRLGAILSAGQVATPPVQMIGPQGIPTVNYSGMVYKNADLEMDAYKQRMANQRQMMSGMFGLVGKMI